jgi:copper chaperone CopZ
MSPWWRWGAGLRPWGWRRRQDFELLEVLARELQILKLAGLVACQPCTPGAARPSLVREFAVEMVCPACVKAVHLALGGAPGVEEVVSVDRDSQPVVVRGPATTAELLGLLMEVRSLGSAALLA